MAWPAKLPRWATGTTAAVTEPSESKKDLGWAGPPEKPPHQTFNWWQKNVYEWINQLQIRNQPYASLEAMIAATAVGESAMVQGSDFDSAWAVVETSTTGLADPAGIDVDGEYVYICGGTGLCERRPRSDLDTTDVDYSANLSGTPTSFVGIASNGTHVAVGYITAGNDLVDVFNATAGTLVGTYNCGSDVVNTVRMMGAFTYVGAGNFIRKLDNTSPATPTQSYDHSAVITSVQCSRGTVMAIGAGRTTTVGNATIGDDVLWLNGTSLTVIGGRSLTNGPNSDNVDTIDGEFVYLFDNAASPSEVAVVSLNGDLPPGISDTYGFSGLNLPMAPEGVSCDDKWLYLALDSDLYIYDKRTIARIDSVVASGVAEGCVASDGDMVFVLGEITGSAYFLRSHKVPNTTRRYYRVDIATEQGTPYRVKAIPVGA